METPNNTDSQAAAETPNYEKFVKRFHFLALLMLLINLLDFLWLDTSKGVLLGLLGLVPAMVLGVVTALGMYKRRYWSTFLVAFLLITGSWTFASVYFSPMTTLALLRIVALAMSWLLMQAIFYTLYKFNKEACAYFQRDRVFWFGFPVVPILAVLFTAMSLVGGYFIKDYLPNMDEAVAMQEQLILEGDVLGPEKQKLMLSCRKKMARHATDEVHLHRLCVCVVLNMDLEALETEDGGFPDKEAFRNIANMTIACKEATINSDLESGEWTEDSTHKDKINNETQEDIRKELEQELSEALSD